MAKIYLAGPDVFLPDGRAVLERKCDHCAAAGHVGISPLAGDAPEDAMAIFAKCEAAMDRSDVILANMTPFRGPGMDAGTAYEVGYMRARGKPAFAYCNIPGDYAGRVAKGDDGGIDEQGLLIEDFGLPENLMLAGAANAFDSPIFQPAEVAADPWRDLTAFKRALAALAAWLDRRQ